MESLLQQAKAKYDLVVIPLGRLLLALIVGFRLGLVRPRRDER
jgi:hypothetical protein